MIATGELRWGYASSDNLKQAKAVGVQDVCFAKKRGLKVLKMVKSSWLYKRLRDFRAGVEGMISYLKWARIAWNEGNKLIVKSRSVRRHRI